MRRRRFLALAAAAAGASAVGLHGALRPEVSAWRGRALGADAEIRLRGPARLAEPALAAARAEIARAEALFSLHRPDSALSRLNRDGVLRAPPAAFLAVLDLAGEVHAATGGLFDPSVQTLWALEARGEAAGPALARALAAVGWGRVRAEAAAVRLAPGMALTLNGIAQGWAADRVAEALAAHGFPDALVDAGELRAGRGAWRVGVAAPDGALLETRSLTRSALATSSPGALRFADGRAHILHPAVPELAPLWATVSVEAETAALADAVSTALVFLTEAEARRLPARLPGLRRLLLATAEGEVRTVEA
ncbi:FAD:protein FMN transferase [Albimonas sp. CAU 1670]|uniref:FAD:protein FMN transferase n=1 Tax=Albimonas sp. CAU 1670 TaxID=3032599 RepID=UPI0023DAC740|nr:FAD:protein FMN transferase [Albimonas sp. CAU 1670]MDF2235630.1 FAD:protein FMN transferase [Albimonas sp. CAU 1670]